MFLKKKKQNKTDESFSVKQPQLDGTTKEKRRDKNPSLFEKGTGHYGCQIPKVLHGEVTLLFLGSSSFKYKCKGNDLKPK